MEGASEGPAVGGLEASVGTSETASVGIPDGVSVGLLESTVGGADGMEVGLKLGSGVGSKDGSRIVGRKLGILLMLGASVSLFLGSFGSLLSFCADTSCNNNNNDRDANRKKILVVRVLLVPSSVMIDSLLVPLCKIID
jgi:hypothetical protein